MGLEQSILFGFIAGVVCGLAPPIFGAMRARMALGVGGFVACAAAGAVLGLLLAVPVAIVFVYFIHRSTRTARTAPQA